MLEKSEGGPGTLFVHVAPQVFLGNLETTVYISRLHVEMAFSNTLNKVLVELQGGIICFLVSRCVEMTVFTVYSTKKVGSVSRILSVVVYT